MRGDIADDTRLAHRTPFRIAMTAMAIAGAAAGSACGGGNGSLETQGQVGGTPAATYDATVTWTRPALNTDGSPLSDAVGYRVDYGIDPTNLTLSVSVAGVSSTSATIDGLSAGTYYFAVATLNSVGVASTGSAVVSKTLP